MPDLAQAVSGDRATLLEALDRSLAWFEKPSSRQYYPIAGVSHQRARLSVAAFRELVSTVAEPFELQLKIYSHFDFWQSVGKDGRGTVQYTGYYSPLFAASRQREAGYRFPLYRAPDDLLVDEYGQVQGRRVGNRIEPYPTRAEIERSGMLAGSELAWLRDGFEAYVLQVQGSGALLLPDGGRLNVSYAGNNGHEYVSIARALVADGKLSEAELSLDSLRAYFAANPEDLERYLHRNPRYVFFREDDNADWPTGSLGLKVTPLRSLAIDKELFPRGGVTLIVTQAPDTNGGWRRLERFMLDQDAGGAIRTAGRADIYYGVGREAELLAGRQRSEGQLYFLFLKPGRVAEWRARLGGED